jgi:hypothetical protein
VKSLIFYAVALVLLSSCGGGGGGSPNELLNQTDQTLDVNQESIIGGSSFGYAKFQ